VSVVHEIESSQHRLAEQMAAVQSLLATKVLLAGLMARTGRTVVFPPCSAINYGHTASLPIFDAHVLCLSVLMCHILGHSFRPQVDRAEAPLLKAAADTLRDADEFRAAAQRRLDVLEADVAAARRVLAAKEDKETVVQRMQKVAEQLAKKAGAFALHLG
jgi:hypothetical protein